MYRDFYWLLVAILLAIWSARYAMHEYQSTPARHGAGLFGAMSAVFLLISLGFHVFG